ncbi:uncharacterized protein BDZ99DRAFT_503790 [Mytilinidion resinicola]|uniref:Cytochrome b561 domain-containing protein n=1 Tax=Mytilinidion resinicola TaxID=574789 RepID=A0A6A6Y1D7_9PEZI|nr:uncharacterized protein BDZ99DRAFT_503790 [Mytilinidion resinicola]KAF2802592.1 hypothetical protein BDZ99DRAFT_503790 [Mytilinidion resinicola]
MASKILRLVLLLAPAAITTAYGDSSPGPTYSNPNFLPTGDSSKMRDTANFRRNLTAHAILAALAFVILFPTGGIIVRLVPFRLVWFVHGVLQLFAILVFVAAFGLGIYLATSRSITPDGLMNKAHVIIGIVLFGLLFLQLFLGVLHHLGFKKTGTRGAWSYAHVWLGRALITLGIVNGALGLKLARDTGTGGSNMAIIAYSVFAGPMWLAYMTVAVFGEVTMMMGSNENVGKENASLEG